MNQTRIHLICPFENSMLVGIGVPSGGTILYAANIAAIKIVPFLSARYFPGHILDDISTHGRRMR